MDHATQQQLRESLQLLGNAASAATVECHVVIEPHHSNPREWLVFLPTANEEQHIHTIGKTGPAWSSSGLANVLAARNKPNLVMCGFWLETKVSFLALWALASGFDVVMAMDAAPSYTQHAREPSFARLLQAGVVPTTTHQLIAEWAEQATDSTLRADLSGLLP